MYPTQLAAEAMAVSAGYEWPTLPELLKQAYLDAADAACKGIVAGEDGWRIVRTEDLPDGVPPDARDDNVEIIEEWTCD
jgi:hypothetical protein